ncbi:AAA family ATPase [Neisseria shayeganii]|uniref:ATP-binding protein n=1 Tax=Neisseria shayeganii 871 TaxID=1032488 RepID=G4CG63_9NEIS|nr:AAA family ATPase [Neisseria shayeganii]EGY53111.1 hypothetical protein HMPREF9371_0602 [Neisseria shayeganii 871]
MAIVTMILGESGTGKSASLRNLKPDNTLLIQAISKPLPFRAAGWKVLDKDGGNIFPCDDSDRIIKAMQRSSRDIIVIDDFQYLMANEFMRGVTDEAKGNEAFQKFNRIARHAWDILDQAAKLPDHKRVYILGHTQTDDSGKTRIKTVGKLLDEKITLEGMVTTVLRTQAINGNYLFQTHNNGNDTCKSPMGMFEPDLIENDLAAVDAVICDYYGQQPQPSNEKETENV